MPVAASDAPASLTVYGTVPLSQVGAVMRAHLLGLVEIYSLALYAERTPFDRAHALSPDAPKALRIEVKYTHDLYRRVPFDWRPELVPALEPAARTHLSGTFAPLRAGDVVLIEYTPDKGTAVRVNNATAVSGAKHELMLAFLDHWLGQRPVSEEIKRALTGSS